MPKSPPQSPLPLPQLGADGRILEGIVTTHNEDGTVNISPMGPIVNTQISRFRFRPYPASTTYQNLCRNGRGVFHVTDDVLLFAQAAVGQPKPLPALEGLVLKEACRWFAFEIESIDDSQTPVHIVANTVDQGRQRDFLGFNRAKHAVLEAAILATRVRFLPAAEILAELKRLESPVTKTASSTELEAFLFLRKHIDQSIRQQQRDTESPA